MKKVIFNKQEIEHLMFMAILDKIKKELPDNNSDISLTLSVTNSELTAELLVPTEDVASLFQTEAYMKEFALEYSRKRKVYNTLLSDLDFRPRLYNLLKKQGFNVLGEVMDVWSSKGPDYFLKIKGFSKNSLAELEAVIKQNNG